MHGVTWHLFASAKSVTKAAFPLSPARPNDRRPRQANAMQATIPTDAQIIRNGIAGVALRYMHAPCKMPERKWPGL